MHNFDDELVIVELLHPIVCADVITYPRRSLDAGFANLCQ